MSDAFKEGTREYHYRELFSTLTHSINLLLQEAREEGRYYSLQVHDYNRDTNRYWLEITQFPDETDPNLVMNREPDKKEWLRK